MNISHEVILDLLPVYLAGEASPATRALVESYLSEHAAFAEQVRRQQADDFGEFARSAPTALPPDLELRTLHRTRTLLRWQRWLFGFGIGLTTSGLASEFSFNSPGLTNAHFLLRDYPGTMVPLVLLGVACWVAYFSIGRRLRTLASSALDADKLA
jgi:predicted anti-sigma-YlaC factor YlaD